MDRNVKRSCHSLMRYYQALSSSGWEKLRHRSGYLVFEPKFEAGTS